MKKFIVFSICVLAFLRVNGQRFSYEYEYDNAGNRIRSTVIYLNNRESFIDNDEMKCFEITESILDPIIMKLYPNPTQANVKYELTGEKTIEKYVLMDMTGRLITENECNSKTFIIDLSSNTSGIYVLTIFIENKPYFYKIIKQ